jgi:hypothetical protein
MEMDTETFANTCFTLMQKINGSERPDDKFERILIINDIFNYIHDNLDFVTSSLFSEKEKRDVFLKTVYSKSEEFLPQIREYNCGTNINKFYTCRDLEKTMVEIMNAIEEYFGNFKG